MSFRSLLSTVVFVALLAPVFSQNGSVATSYTQTACGLTYTQGSVRLNQRVFDFSPATGAVQPASITISGLPSCAGILKAFLYVGVSGNGVPITASVTNPAQTSTTFPLAIIGSDDDLCWGFPGTRTYRADVTSIISGNGDYILSGIPTTSVFNVWGANDANGATLFIIYQDYNQNYTGSIVLAQGCNAISFSSPVSSVSINGFSVCANPTLTENFMLLSDLQQLSNTYINFNTVSTLSASANYTKTGINDAVWDFITAPGDAAVAGQTSANYATYNPGYDCYAMVLAGMYYQTNCLGCIAGSYSPSITVNVSGTASCVCTATAFATGGPTPYSYSWTGTNQTNSVVTGLGSGQYNVSVTSADGCLTASATIELLSQEPVIVATNTTVCFGQATTVTLSAVGASSYSWSGPSNFSSTADSFTVVAGGTPGTTQYNVIGTSANLCSGSATAIITTTTLPSIQISASKTLICNGGSVTLTPSGAVTYTWLASSVSQTQGIVVMPSADAVYSVQGTDANGCNNTSTVLISVSPCVGIGEEAMNADGISVYPNPSDGRFEITAAEKMTLYLINALGEQISTIELNEETNHRLLVSDLAPGIYYLVSKNTPNLSLRKIVIER